MNRPQLRQAFLVAFALRLGDQFVHIHIWTPVKISKEEKEILEKLKTSENFSPSADTKDPGFFKRMRDIFS
jgi:molecular chaperone DnaJ